MSTDTELAKDYQKAFRNLVAEVRHALWLYESSEETDDPEEYAHWDRALDASMKRLRMLVGLEDA